MEKYTRCVCVCVNVYKINDPIAEENFTQYPITENAGIIPERQLNLDRCIQSEQAWWQIQLLLIKKKKGSKNEIGIIATSVKVVV